MRYLALWGALVVLPGVIHAQAVTGLGESLPAAQDVSSSPQWHVYVFERGATRFIQVNDSVGHVRGAVARTPYSLVGLPIGSDAARVATPDEPQPLPDNLSGETIYEGNQVKVFVSPAADGTARLFVAPGECTDPPPVCTSR